MKEEQPLVSIIIPVYNVEKYLRTCLDSLVSQTLENIEIICVNDASPDNSLAILREYEERDKRIIVIDLKKNLRQGGARNRGIKIARAKYIAFVDSDDWVANNMYELLYNKIISASADLVHCDYYRYSTEILKADRQFEKNTWLKHREMANKDFIMVSEFPVTALYNRNLFVTNDLYFPEHTFYEDTAITYLLYLLANKVEHIDEPLYYYRIHSSSTTHRKGNDNYFQCANTVLIFLENAKRLGFYEKYEQEMEFVYIRYAYWSVIWGALTLFSSIRKDKIKQAKTEIKKEFPYYRKNVYYRKRVFTKKRMILYCVDINTELGVLLTKCFYWIRSIMKGFKKIL